MSGWYVYIVKCQRGLYTGISENVEGRVETHNSGKGAKALKALGLPAQLVYKEFIGSRSGALKREHEIKQFSKAEKEQLIINKGAGT